MIKGGILGIQLSPFLCESDGPDRGSDGACRGPGHHLEPDSVIGNRRVGPTLLPFVERLCQKIEDASRIRSRRNRPRYRKTNLKFFLRQIRHKPNPKSKYRPCRTTSRANARWAELTKIINDDCDNEDTSAACQQIKSHFQARGGV